MNGTIITDISGGTLRLSKTRLTELTGGTSFYLKLKDFAKKFKEEGKSGSFIVRIYSKVLNGGSVVIHVGVPGKRTDFVGNVIQTGKIGCRTLSKKDFNKVLKAAKATLVTGTSKKATTAVKTLAAAAGRAKR